MPNLLELLSLLEEAGVDISGIESKTDALREMEHRGLKVPGTQPGSSSGSGARPAWMPAGAVRLLPASSNSFATLAPDQISEALEEEKGSRVRRHGVGADASTSPRTSDEESAQSDGGASTKPPPPPRPTCAQCGMSPAAAKVTLLDGTKIVACRPCIDDLQSDAAKRVCERCGKRKRAAVVRRADGSAQKVCRECVAELTGGNFDVDKEKAKREAGGGARRGSQLDVLAKRAQDRIDEKRAAAEAARMVDAVAKDVYEAQLQTALEKDVEAPLPKGWRVAQRKSDGRVYYFHTKTKQTSWSRPTE